MDNETKRMKLAYWSGIIKESKSSGMKISEWCKVNQISNRKYYYWHKKVMHDTYTMAVENGLLAETKNNTSGRDLPAVPEFAELTIPDANVSVPEHSKNPGINIKWGGFTIAVDAEFSEGELLKVLRVMNHVE